MTAQELLHNICLGVAHIVKQKQLSEKKLLIYVWMNDEVKEFTLEDGELTEIKI